MSDRIVCLSFFLRHPYFKPTSMRALLALIILAVAIGCESDVPPAPNGGGGNPFERGMSGQGTLTQPDKSDDPLIKGSTPNGN